MSLTLCIVQFDRSSPEPDVNRQKMLAVLNNINMPCDVMLLPEDWLGPLIVEGDYYTNILCDLQKVLPGPDVLLVSGAQYVRYPRHTISTGAFVCHNGVYYYDKLFPSLAIGERSYIAPGERLSMVRHRNLNLASLICVDLFYPEIMRRLAFAGAVIVFNPASIPIARIKLWHSLGIARAAENTVFLAMANNSRTSYPDGRKVSGGSFVAGPDGKFFRTFGPEPGTYFVELDTRLVGKARERWKYLADAEELDRSNRTVSIEHYNINF